MSIGISCPVTGPPFFPVVESTLSDARSDIVSRLSPLGCELVPVTGALCRVSSEPLCSTRPRPSYNQSARDGFALAAQPYAIDAGWAVFQLTGEVAAGCVDERTLQSGEAVRIMTGAMVPHSTARVVPFEICRESGAAVRVPSEALDEPQQFIRRRGSVAREGVELVAPGTRLQPDHLMMLAESGSRQVPVFRRPSVAVVCTGSELVEPGSAIRPGRKISGNGVLLSSLLRSGGAVCHGVVTVEDRVNAVLSVLEKLLENDVDLIITTGGMGPGKFDLMEQVFARLGGELVYNRLRVRPGKSTLFGLVGGKPFFALPGPPPAVRILFHELVGPAVARLQGMRDDGGLAEAVLRGSVPMQQKGYPCLKGGVARLVCGRLQVRKADQMESVNAVIHFGTQRCGAGDTVRVRLVGPLS